MPLVMPFALTPLAWPLLAVLGTDVLTEVPPVQTDHRSDGVLLSSVLDPPGVRAELGETRPSQEAPDEGAPSDAPASGTRPAAADPSAATPGGTTPGGTPEEARRRGRGWNDRRRTVRSYANNLGFDALRVFTLPNAVPLFVGASLATGANAVDPEGVSFFRHNEMTTFGNVGSTAGGTGVVLLFGAGLFSAGRIAPGDRFRSASYDASQAILITSVYNATFKLVVRRERPNGADHNSFPSGHTSIAFSWATVLGKHYGPKIGVPAYAVATLIGLSRMAHRSHFLSDVAAGAVLGHLVGRTVVRGNSRAAAGVPADPVIPDPVKTSLGVFPSLAPGGGGLQLVLRF